VSFAYRYRHPYPYVVRLQVAAVEVQLCGIREVHIISVYFMVVWTSRWETTYPVEVNWVELGVFTLPFDPFGPVFGLDRNGPVGSIGSARKLHTPPLCGAYSTSSDPAGPLDPIGTDAWFPTDARIRG
jgi:hypothetical protein